MYTYISSTYTQHSPPGGAYRSTCATGGVSASRHLPLTIDHLPLHTDHLGSITMATRANGSVAETFSYDAWGRRRNATNWAYTGATAPIFSRGYTGHEHIDVLGIINMNGRMYDPRLGMFMSADPVVQQPGNPLNYNRYSYVLNNPLKYTDPSGYKNNK